MSARQEYQVVDRDGNHYSVYASWDKAVKKADQLNFHTTFVNCEKRDPYRAEHRVVTTGPWETFAPASVPMRETPDG